MDGYISGETTTPPEGLDRVDQLDLAIRASIILNPTDLLKVDPFASLREGDLYRPDTSQPASTASTAAAVDGITALRLKVPESVIAQLHLLAESVSATDSIQELINEDIPVARALSEVNPNLLPTNIDAATLKSWRTTVLDTGVGPVQLGLLGDLMKIDRSLGLAWKGLPRNFAVSLQVADSGFYSINSASEPDAQVTFDAAELGLNINRVQAAQTLKLGLGPDGWMFGLTPVSVSATYEASTILKECGKPLPDLTASIGRSIADLGKSPYSPENTLQLYGLARLYHVPVPKQIQRSIAKNSAAFAVQSAESGQVMEAAIALLANGSSANRQVAAIVRRMSAPDNARDAAAQCEIGNLADDKYLIGRSKAVIATLRIGHAYALTPKAEEPDLYSTALAFSCIGALNDAVLSTATEHFTRDGFYFSTLPTASSAESTLDTAFAGTAMFVSPDAIFGVM